MKYYYDGVIVFLERDHEWKLLVDAVKEKGIYLDVKLEDFVERDEFIKKINNGEIDLPMEVFLGAEADYLSQL